MLIQQVGITTNTSNNTSPISLSKSYTQEVGSNLILVVCAASRNNSHTNVTFNGINLTKEIDETRANCRSSIWYLFNPPITTADVVLNMSSGGPCSIIITSWQNVKNISNNNSDSNRSQNITGFTCNSNEGELVIDSFIHRRHQGIFTTGNVNQIALHTNSVSGDFKHGVSYIEGQSPNVQFNWNNSNRINNWAIAAISLKPIHLHNYYKIEQLIKQSTTSTIFQDIAGATLTFTPHSTSQIWIVFVSGKCHSNNTGEQPYEIRLTINDVEKDLWSHQNSNATEPCAGGFLIFDYITDTISLQTIKLQFKALTGTCYADTIRIVAFRLPANSDFQFYRSDNIISTIGANQNLGSLQFSPSSTGNYYIFGSIKHREYPSGNTSQARFQGSDGSIHPNTATNVFHSNARDPWNPATYAWRENLTTGQKTFSIIFTSSGNGSQTSEHRYRKFMAFREDVWDKAYYDLSAHETTTTGDFFLAKNSITTVAPPEARNYISIQCARIGGATTTATIRKSGVLRIDGVTKIQTDHKISRDDSNTQGYHHTIGLCDVLNTDQAITYENGLLAPNGHTVSCAESAIIILRYPVEEEIQENNNDNVNQMLI